MQIQTILNLCNEIILNSTNRNHLKFMQIEINKVYKNNGFLRQILSINGNAVEIKTVGVPAYRTPGRPPRSGIVKVSSVKKWIKKKWVKKQKKENRRQKIQLLI